MSCLLSRMCQGRRIGRHNGVSTMTSFLQASTMEARNARYRDRAESTPEDAADWLVAGAIRGPRQRRNVGAAGPSQARHDGAMTPDEIADELYGLPPEQFITTRNARAKELSDAGDRETAASIRKLQKPSPAAGLVNVLVRTHPDGIAEVVALGTEFRRAQKRGSGDDLRSLAATRRDLLRRLLTLAATETNAMGHQWTTGLGRQIAATLEAAMADEILGAAVLRGRLT